VSDNDPVGIAPPVAEAPAAPSLGQQLRAARLALGLSIEDVVPVLKFSSRQIEAIETDRMDAGSGSVFLRGLVRSYASFLRLDPKPLLRILDELAPVRQPEIRVPENMGNAISKWGIHRTLLLVGLSVLLLFVAGAIIGWHYLGDGVAQNVEGSASVATAISVEASVVQQEEIVSATQTEVPVVPSLPPESEQPAAAAVPSVAAKVKPAPAAPAQMVPAASAATAPLPAEGRRLSFQFQGESWIEVKDASDTVVLSGTFQGGTTRSVAGRGPFEIVIGNASAVTLKDDGQPVDLKPYIRAEVARLILK
jgi:cytoskeleton protein RodZ